MLNTKLNNIYNIITYTIILTSFWVLCNPVYGMENEEEAGIEDYFIGITGGLSSNIDEYIDNLKVRDRFLNMELSSNYQTFITPDNTIIQEFARNKSYEDLYKESIEWVWVEDKILHETVEKWLKPEEFLLKTKTYETNPVKGSIASDCEEQAYTLVSMLRAVGMKVENIRVVTGEVTIEDKDITHVWVETYDEQDHKWVVLDPSLGNRYDSQTEKLIKSKGLPYDYFKTHDYPAKKVFHYFNDRYIWDMKKGEGDAPWHWYKELSH